MSLDTWLEFVTPTGFLYFMNSTTGATQWEVPPVGARVIRGGAAPPSRAPRAGSGPTAPHATPVRVGASAAPGQGAAASAASAASPSSAQGGGEGHGSGGDSPPAHPGDVGRAVQQAKQRWKSPRVRRTREDWREAWLHLGVKVEEDPVDPRRGRPSARTSGEAAHGSSASPEVLALEDLPSMTPATKKVLLGAHASTKREGYATSTRALDLGTLRAMQLSQDHKLVGVPSGYGAAGKTTALFSSMIQRGAPVPQGRPGERVWLSQSEDPRSASQTAPGYAYKHATRSAGVFQRLTDVRGFTGAHRLRFDESGRGKGLFGRDRLEKDHLIGGKDAASPVPYLTTRTNPR